MLVVLGLVLALVAATRHRSSPRTTGARDTDTTTQPTTTLLPAGRSPLHVISITSSGTQPGTAEVGSTLTVTFDRSIDPATVDTKPGDSAITFCDADRTAGPPCVANGANTPNVAIKGLASATAFTTANGSGVHFVKPGRHATAPGTLRLTNDDKTISFTISGPFRGTGSIRAAPAPVSFTFTPIPTIADTSGNRATNPFRQPAIRLF